MDLLADRGRRVSLEELNTSRLLAHARKQAVQRSLDDILFAVGLHPSTEMVIELCWAYNRWLTEKALPEGDGRLYSMLSLPFSDADEALRQVETFGDRKHVTGFLVTSARTLPVHHNAYMKVY